MQSAIEDEEQINDVISSNVTSSYLCCALLLHRRVGSLYLEMWLDELRL